jgi:uncharacterized protein (DUF2236 family)
MTADLYAAAAGLVERSAAAYASGVPGGDAADDGFFGPASLTWRVSTDLASPVAGLRSLLMQALHPLAMAGVDQHSGWRQDPVGRLAATSAYLATITFGERAAAAQAAARVRRIHAHVRGVDPVTGGPYAAGDPALLLWVHVAMVQSSLAAGWAFGTPLPAQDGERKQRRHDPLSEGSVTMSRRSSVSRRRENRTYGLKGGWGNGPLAAPRP